VDDFLTPPEIAKLLKVSTDTVRRLIDSGALPGTRLTDDSWRRVERQQLIEYARARQISLDWSLLGTE
jgi:excisionase family DNA binding protein